MNLRMYYIVKLNEIKGLWYIGDDILQRLQSVAVFLRILTEEYHEVSRLYSLLLITAI